LPVFCDLRLLCFFVCTGPTVPAVLVLFDLLRLARLPLAFFGLYFLFRGGIIIPSKNNKTITRNIGAAVSVLKIPENLEANPFIGLVFVLYVVSPFAISEN
jgi:hypothetical protein